MDAQHLSELRSETAAYNWPLQLNGYPPLYGVTAANVDILGAGEYSSYTDSTSSLISQGTLLQERAFAYQKPLSIMDYSLGLYNISANPAYALTLIEPDLNYYLMYGIYPGTGNCWATFDIDKLDIIVPVYEQYMPIFLAMNEAGWQPVGAGTCTDSTILLEQWGNSHATGLYYTINNTATSSKNVTVSINDSQITGPAPTGATEMISGSAIGVSTSSGTSTFTLSVGAGRTVAVNVVLGTIPGTPVVSAPSWVSTQSGTITASWSATGSGPSIVGYEYAIGSTPGGSDVVAWTSAGTATSLTQTGLTLTAGSTYYFSVKAENTNLNWSIAGVSSGILAIAPIGAIRNNPNGTTVGVTDALVTAGTNQLLNVFYIESMDRSSGIQVSGAGLTAHAGDLVQVSGALAGSQGERLIGPPVTLSVIQSGFQTPAPLYLPGIDVGEIQPNQYTNGTNGGMGLYNLGLLVTISGAVSYSDPSNRFFYVDDGSGKLDGSGYTGVRVIRYGVASGVTIPGYSAGSFVMVTGVIGCITSGGTIPVIRPRAASDVTLIAL